MGLLQHFPNQHWSLCALPIDRSPWSMDGVQGWVDGLCMTKVCLIII